MAKRAAALVLCLVVLSACATESSPRASLNAINEMQEELADLDDRAATLRLAAADASLRGAELLDDYRSLAERGRSERPEGAVGAEDDLWAAFVEILDLRVEGADVLLNAIESGDPTSAAADIEALEEQNAPLVERFNRALAHFRDDEPPGD